MTHLEACLALNLISGMGPVRMRRLLEVLGTPENILRASTDRLQAAEGIGPELARRIAGWEKDVDLPAEIVRMEEAGVHAITPEDDVYPRLLKEIYDPPIVLYVWGELTARDARAVGIVGSRRPSIYGLETAKRFSHHLALAGWTVVSGLARGIDTVAHQGALAAPEGRTVGVLGCGLGGIYPPENFALAERIAGGRGAVISEFPMTMRPDKQTFPMRNRIISGLSRGVLVVEAGENSGALISAHQAVEQGRTVFAVPGQIDRPEARGSNRLLREGARFVTDAGDVLDELSQLPFQQTVAVEPRGFKARPTPPPAPPEPAAPRDSPPLTPTETTVLAALEPGSTETPVDLIIRRSGLPTGQVSATLFALELKRAVRQLPGKVYVRAAL